MTQNMPPTGPPPGAPPQGAPAAGQSFLDDSFGRLRTSGFVRDSDARWFGGVCSGLARRLGVDPTLIRAAAIVLAFVGGVGLTLYVLLWLLMPDRRGEILAERGIRHGDVGAIALLGLAGLLVLGGIASVGSGDGWIAPLWLIPVALVAWFVLSRRGTLDGPADGAGGPGPVPPPPYGTPPAPYAPVPYGSVPPVPHDPAPSAPAPTGEIMSAPPTSPTYGGYRTPAAGQYATPYGGRPTPPVPPRPIAPPPPPKPRRRRPSAFIGLMSLGIAIVGIGLGAALDGPTGFPGSQYTLAYLIALAGVSVVVLVLGLRGRASGFSGFLVFALSFLLAMALVSSQVPTRDGVGERTWSPVPTVGTTTYELGAGDAVLDLDGLVTTTPRSTPQTIEVDMGAGELTILVPEGLDARIDANVGFGSIRHTGSTVTDVDENSGPDRSTSMTIGDTPVEVIIDAELGLGQITIQEQ